MVTDTNKSVQRPPNLEVWCRKIYMSVVVTLRNHKHHLSSQYILNIQTFSSKGISGTRVPPLACSFPWLPPRNCSTLRCQRSRSWSCDASRSGDDNCKQKAGPVAKSQPLFVQQVFFLFVEVNGKSFFLLKGWEFECKIQLGLGGLHVQYPNLKKELDH